MPLANKAEMVVPETRRSFAGRLTLLLTLLFLLSSTTAFAAVSIPDWVRQAVAQTLPSYPPDTNAVVLLSDETDTVTGPNEHIEHYRRVVKILRPDGRDQGELAVLIGHQSKLTSVHSWSIDTAGHEYELKDKDFTEHGNAYWAMYDDYSWKQAQAPATAPGTVIAFEYEVRRHDYFDELNWFPQEDNPVLRAVFTVQLPSGWELKEWWSSIEPVKPAAAGPNGWQWVKTDVPGIEDEPHRPSLHALAGRLSIQLYSSTQPMSADWGAVSKWASDLFKTQRTTSPEMTAKVAQLTQGKSNYDARVRALTEFVQREFRYYAIEIGVGGFQPHLASEVFQHRYGDCKDKANTLATLLSLAGINSDPVLIHTHRGIVRPELPSTYFNHAILAIEVPAGTSVDEYPAAVTTKAGKRYVIFDPTDEFMAFGQVRSELQESYALIISDSGGELIRVPKSQPDATQLVRSAKLKLTPDGTISGDFHEKLTGDFAERLRAVAENNNQQQQLQRYEDQVAHSLKNASIQGLTFDGLKELNQPVDVRYNLIADRYAQIMGPLLIVRPRVLGVKAIGLERKPRKYPLVIGGTTLEKDDFELQIPPGYTLDDKPDPVSLDTPFASYKSQIEVKGDRLHYSREYVMKSLEIPSNKIEDLRAFENKVAADENAAVVFKKVPVAQGQD